MNKTRITRAMYSRVGALGLVLTQFPAILQAQQSDPASDRAQTFVPVEGPQVEDVPGGPLMVAAYALIWVLVFGYLWMLAKRARKLEGRIADLEARRS